jgi:hypothetical protein
MHYLIRKPFLALLIAITLLPGLAAAGGRKGINPEALEELSAAGVDKYLGAFTPVSTEDVGDGWTKHSFDSAGGEGPICIDGSDYSVFTRKGKDRKKLLIMLQGGGACWEGLYRCSESTAGQEAPGPREGIWDFDRKDNPFAKYSIVYMPYCDGSVFGGDNTVVDPAFDSVSGVDGVRHHRGLRNLSAGMDVAKATFKKPKRVTVAGSSAGGVGAAALAPFLVRFQYGNKLKDLSVFNDAGPIAISLDAQDAMAARSRDWQFDKFYPASCTDCSPFGQATAIVRWRLDNDSTIREAFYETDADETNIGFASVNLPGFFDPLPPIIPFPTGLTQNQYRDLVVDTHAPLNEAYPKRYRRFIVSGDASHTALQFPLFYTQDVNGVLLKNWTRDFIKNKKSWWDLVEDFVAVPTPTPE